MRARHRKLIRTEVAFGQFLLRSGLALVDVSQVTPAQVYHFRDGSLLACSTSDDCIPKPSFHDCAGRS